jgi:hypothetical protein
MKKSKLLIPIFFILVLAAACGKASPTAAPTNPPTLVPPTPTRMPPTSTPLPPTDTPLPIVPPEPEIIVIDAFEAAQTGWQAGMEPEYTDSSATGVALSSDQASQSPTGDPSVQSLRLDFEKNDKPKAIFYILKSLDFSRSRSIQFDIYNPGTINGVAFGVITGPDGVWFESQTTEVPVGRFHGIGYDLATDYYKALSTNWEFRTPILDQETIQRLAIVLFPVREGSVYLDNILLIGPR